jgi:hypothetical protein
MRLYHLAVLAFALSAPLSEARACFGEAVTEVSFEGDLGGSEPFKLATPATDSEPARVWVDDDGLPTLMSILQAVANKRDPSAYDELFKKSLERLANQSTAYLAQDNIDDETKAFYKSVAAGAKKFLASTKGKPLDKKIVADFYEKMGETLRDAIQEGVYAYQVLDPKTGKFEDQDQPFTVVGQFGPAVKFWDKIEGNIPRGVNCGGYTMKIKPSKPASAASGSGTYMVNQGN